MMTETLKDFRVLVFYFAITFRLYSEELHLAVFMIFPCVSGSMPDELLLVMPDGMDGV